MKLTMLLVADHCVNIHMLHTAENVAFHLGTFCMQHLDQFLGTLTLGSIVRIARGAGVRKLAGALDKVQAVIIPPVLNAAFPHQVQRADQFHTGKVGAVQLGHHGLHLTAVQHAH